MSDKADGSSEKYLVPAVEQAAKILFSLAGSDASQVGLLELCKRVGVHRSKAYSILQTLQKYGLVQKMGERKGYSLGPGLVALSRKVLDDLNAPRLAEPMLADLATRIGGTATLGMIAGDRVFVVARHEGVDIGINIRVGHRFPLSYGCHGKAIAAFMPDAERELLLKQEHLHFHGTPERLDRERLGRELEACRREGYGLDLGEMKPGLNAVAAPVFAWDGTPSGYIALIGLFSVEAAREFGPQVAAAANRLSRQMGVQLG